MLALAALAWLVSAGEGVGEIASIWVPGLQPVHLQTENSDSLRTQLGMFPLELAVLNGDYSPRMVIPIKDCYIRGTIPRLNPKLDPGVT